MSYVNYNKSVEQCIMGYAVKYEKLGNIIKELFTNNKYSSATEINMFIPLTELFHTLSDVFIGKCDLSITATVLNLCAHYKNFFKKGYGVECNIYLIHTTEEYNFNKNYTSDYIHKNGKICDPDIDKACEMLKIICPYLNNIQFLKTTNECALIMMDIDQYTSSSAKNIPNLVLSKDMYNSQLVTISEAEGIFEFIMIRPTKYQGEDNTFYITRNNVYEAFCRSRKVALTDSILKLPSDGKTYSLLMAMTRTPERNIKSLYSIPTAVKMILETADRSTWSDAFIINCRYNAISLNNQWAMYVYNEMIKYSGYPNLYDPQSIEEISNKYFKKYPVDFLSLI